MYDSEALRKDVEQSKRSLEFTVQPSNSTPRFKPKRTTNICPHKHLYINVHRSIIHNNQKVETINEQRNKMWYIHAAAAKSLQSCPTLCNPIDGSPPGSPWHCIFYFFSFLFYVFLCWFFMIADFFLTLIFLFSIEV